MFKMKLILYFVLYFFRTNTAMCFESYHLQTQIRGFCPIKSFMYAEIYSVSSIECAMSCITDERCTRFLYSTLEMGCKLQTHNFAEDAGLIAPVAGLKLFLPAHKDCNVEGYDYDSYSRSCIKFYDETDTMTSWFDARDRCQSDDPNGELVTIVTVEKWQYISMVLKNCSAQHYWIGMGNTTWVTGEEFQNIYNIDPNKIRLDNQQNNNEPKGCVRLRFKSSRKVIADIPCLGTYRFICEIQLLAN